MKTVMETKKYQKSHNQWASAKRRNHIKPKNVELIINTAPMVTHQRMRYGFAPVVTAPPAREP